MNETTSCLSFKQVFVITVCEPAHVCDVCLVLFCLYVVPGTPAVRLTRQAPLLSEPFFSPYFALFKNQIVFEVILFLDFYHF